MATRRKRKNADSSPSRVVGADVGADGMLSKLTAAIKRLFGKG